MVYVWQLEDLQRRHATRTLAATLAAATGTKVDVEDWPQVRAEFDSWLASEPPRVDPDRAALLRAIGLRG